MNFKIVKALPKEYKVFSSLIREVYCCVEKKEWYAADDEAYLEKALFEGNGLGYKALEEESGALAGVLVAVFPGESEENLGFDIGLGLEARKQAAHIDSVAVRPEYQGQGLQGLLMETAEEELKRRGYRYLLCTVHPENIYSRRNMIRLHYERILTKEKYGGMRRDIMMKQLSE